MLLFTRTLGFRHASIPAAAAALQRQAARHGLLVDHTEDPARFSATGLRRYRVVVFLSTTGDVLDPDGEAALRGFVAAGGGGMGADHPIAWCQGPGSRSSSPVGQGRAFYTAGGHTAASWAEARFLAHVVGALRWAAGLAEGDCSHQPGG